MRNTILMAGMLVLAGCAGTPVQDAQPKVVRITPQELERLMPQPAPNLSLDEIVTLSKNGTPADTIIARIRDTHSRYALTPSQMVELHQKGVSLKVLDYIAEAQQQAVRESVADELNQRARKQQEEIQALQRELRMRPYYYDPWPYPPGWYGYPYPRPYWRHW
jgi:hypothetical protein